MIHISVTAAFLLYSIALAGIFFVLYAYTEVGVRRSHRVLTRQFLWRCVFCGYTYLDEGAEAISKCPRCHSLNDEAESRPREVHAKAGKKGSLAPVPDAAEIARRNPSRRKRPHRANRGPRRRR